MIELRHIISDGPNNWRIYEVVFGEYNSCDDQLFNGEWDGDDWDETEREFWILYEREGAKMKWFRILYESWNSNGFGDLEEIK